MTPLIHPFKRRYRVSLQKMMGMALFMLILGVNTHDSTHVAEAQLTAPSKPSVMMVGDSILASNTPIQTDLETLSGNTFRNYAKIGAGLQDGWVMSIPEQYERYRGDVVPTTILMDGGGNDVNGVRSDCERFNDRCQATIDRLVSILDTLFQTMRKDGIKNIMYLGFYYVGRLHDTIDYGIEKIQTVCRPKDGCYVVDLRNLTVQVGWDGMHPVEHSYHDIARKIWEAKEQHDIPM